MISNEDVRNPTFYTLDVEKSFEYLDTNRSGLTEEEAQKRIQLYGRNIIEKSKKRTLMEKLWDQLKNIMVLILTVAALISFFVGDLKSTMIIVLVITMNSILGVIQEGKAEKALESLQKSSLPEAEVLRDGNSRMIKAEDLTIGDIVLLDAGDQVPADLRLIDTVNLKIEEATLTGESVPVEKVVLPLEKEDTVIGDRNNMAFMGTSVTYGRGAGIVTAIGRNTELGKIAEYISGNSGPQETPLQKKLSQMSKYISIIIIIGSSLIFVTGLLWGRSFFEMFLTAVSLAVAAIPEGLPAIVTILLALGVQKMATRNAIIRKLPAVETLGCAEVICTDKTGTLTKNEMTVVKLYLEHTVLTSESFEEGPIPAKRLLEGMLLCNDTRVSITSSDTEELTGDPTETALVKLAHTLNYNKKTIESLMPRVFEVPFDSERKLMTTVNQFEERYFSYTKGALDILLNKCTQILDQGKVRTLTGNDHEMILNANADLTKSALRVIAFGYKELEEIPQENPVGQIEENLIFVGFVGMIDPPRPEVKFAVQKCREAGIKPVMITGDHKDTASAIALELGILENGEEAIEGRLLEGMSDADLLNNIERYSVFARVSPEHKVRIVKAWREKGKVTAMTGDGVNDAPALKCADISIGMGITGTDVAKGVSDMVLADDNFATIVSAVEEGRNIYSSIRKATHFLLSTHLGEVFALFIATMLNWVMLFPIHLLWVNLIIDTLPALALGMEKPEENIMLKKPRKSDQSFFAEGLGVNIVFQGIVKGFLVLIAYYVALNIHNESVAVTTAFATLGLVQLAHTFALRSETKSSIKMGIFTNPHLLFAVGISALLQVSVIIIPGLNDIFKVEQLYWEEWLVTIFASLAIIPIVELQKRLFTKRL